MRKTTGRRSLMVEDRPVHVEDMADARERRALAQWELLGRYDYSVPVLSFTMNIAGAIKNSDLIRRGFEEGLSYLEGQLRGRAISVLYRAKICEHTGNEALLAVDTDGLTLKKIAAKIEDSHPLGRLFDMDVIIARNGMPNKIDRSEMGEDERLCLICGAPVRECAARRIHPAQQLYDKTNYILEHHFFDQFAARIARQAMRALLYEVSVSPKPGLVDRFNNGSHTDMDFYMFIDSAGELLPYFEEMVRIGSDTESRRPEEAFDKMQQAGIAAEQIMYGVTDHINTHKGAIFSLGLLCAAMGRLRGRSGRGPYAEQVLDVAADFVKAHVRDFFDRIYTRPDSAGVRFYKEYGIRGGRGEAADGFPAVRSVGLPMLNKLLSQGYTKDEAGGITLLYLLEAAADTNMLARSDYTTFLEKRRQIAALLEDDPYPSVDEIRVLDISYRRESLSPGGAADLLAVCWFLHFVEQMREKYE